jgi:hypothetical protein
MKQSFGLGILASIQGTVTLGETFKLANGQLSASYSVSWGASASVLGHEVWSTGGSLLNGIESIPRDLGDWLHQVNHEIMDGPQRGLNHLIGMDEPIILDLNGNGVQITQLSQSNKFFDTAGDGYQHRTAWAGAGDGVLVFDAQNDGKIDQKNEIVEWDPTAKSDMQALRDVFDTNQDGKLDSGDAQFAQFKVMVTNADGTTTLETLAAAGVDSINLVENAVEVTLPDGSKITGETTFNKSGGGTGTAATVSLATDALGYALDHTETTSGTVTTIDNKARNADGSLANETKCVLTCLSDGAWPRKPVSASDAFKRSTPKGAATIWL